MMNVKGFREEGRKVKAYASSLFVCVASAREYRRKFGWVWRTSLSGILGMVKFDLCLEHLIGDVQHIVE